MVGNLLAGNTGYPRHFKWYITTEISLLEIQESNVDSSVPQQIDFQDCLEFLCSVGLTSQCVCLLQAPRALQKQMRVVSDAISAVLALAWMRYSWIWNLHEDVLTIAFMDNFPFQELEVQEDGTSTSHSVFTQHYSRIVSKFQRGFFLLYEW